MKLVVIGDVHLFTLHVHPRRLVSRRALAHSNLWLNRRHRFNHTLLPALVEHARSLEPELVLFSGDVSTSSLESEFDDLREVVAPLVESAPRGGVLVPGNHDRYTFKSRRVKRIETLLASVMPAAFPHTQTLAPGWTLLALDSAVPNRVFSRGALGRTQFEAAVRTIRAVPADEALVVLCHYPCSLPPRVPSAWSHDLKEAEPLKRELAVCRGRVLYVHGHIHKPWHVMPSGGGSGLAEPSLPDAGGTPPPESARREPRAGSGNHERSRPAFECLNAGSPCMTSEKYPLGQGFWELTLPSDPLAPVDAVHHVPARPDGTNGLTLAAASHQPRWETRRNL
ncbi:MAG: metallophosphoesterase [Planctomycetota bacterium]